MQMRDEKALRAAELLRMYCNDGAVRTVCSGVRMATAPSLRRTIPP